MEISTPRKHGPRLALGRSAGTEERLEQRGFARTIGPDQRGESRQLQGGVGTRAIVEELQPLDRDLVDGDIWPIHPRCLATMSQQRSHVVALSRITVQFVQAPYDIRSATPYDRETIGTNIEEVGHGPVPSTSEIEAREPLEEFLA